MATAAKKKPPKPRATEYRHDGKNLYYVLHVGPEMSRVENCGMEHCEAEEIPTQQLTQMEVVTGGSK